MTKKIISVSLAVLFLFSVFAIPASAATKTKTQSLTYTYYDSTIKSWKVGRIKAAYTYSYDTNTKKLVNNKSISHSIPTLAIGCKFKDIHKSWEWYDTSSRYGTGYGLTEWSFGMGVVTQWVSLGYFKDGWMALLPKGDGSWSSRFC